MRRAFGTSLLAYQSSPIKAAVKPMKSNADKRYSFYELMSVFDRYFATIITIKDRVARPWAEAASLKYHTLTCLDMNSRFGRVNVWKNITRWFRNRYC